MVSYEFEGKISPVTSRAGEDLRMGLCPNCTTLFSIYHVDDIVGNFREDIHKSGALEKFLKRTLRGSLPIKSFCYRHSLVYH